HALRLALPPRRYLRSFRDFVSNHMTCRENKARTEVPEEGGGPGRVVPPGSRPLHKNLRSATHYNLIMVQRNNLISFTHENLMFVRRNNLRTAQESQIGRAHV